MPTVLFDTTDLGEAEEKLSANFAPVKLATPAGEDPTRLRMLRSTIGSMTLDDTYLSCDVNYRMEPPGRVLLCRGYSGVVEGQHPHHPRVAVGTGQVAALGALDGVPVVGEGHRAHLMVVSIDRGLLSEVAATHALCDVEPVRLTGQAAVSPEGRPAPPRRHRLHLRESRHQSACLEQPLGRGRGAAVLGGGHPYDFSEYRTAGAHH